VCHRTTRNAHLNTTPVSGTFQESKVEGYKYQNDADVRCQPFPKSVFEEQQIGATITAAITTT
jgi:hypothetical protein